MIENADIFQNLSDTSYMSGSILLQKSLLSHTTGNQKDSIALDGFDLDIEEESK